MIDSEEKRQRVTEIVERWVIHTKIKSYLRSYDIPSLAHQIVQEFYHICLSCGHWVNSLNEGTSLEIDEQDGKRYGTYCDDCVKSMLKDERVKIASEAH